MTSQQAVDRVWETFVINRQPPGIEHLPAGPPTCRYRAPGGYKCAIGILIPEDLYEPDMEKHSVVPLIGIYPDLAGVWRDIDYLLLHKIQTTHDQAAIDDAEMTADGSVFTTVFAKRFRDMLTKWNKTVVNRNKVIEIPPLPEELKTT